MKIDRNPSMDEQQLRAALESANIPSLLPALYQLTGDARWIGPEYRPARTRAFEELDSGALPEERQVEIRAAAFDAVLAWSRGAAPAVEHPSEEVMTTLMATALGEDVDSAYAPMIARHLGLEKGPEPNVAIELAAAGRDFSVIIIGAGFSGLAAGIALDRAGIPFTIIEKNEEVGGTWWENRFPGARVDIPTALYSFRFLNNNWPEYFSRRDALADYLVAAADRFGLRDRIHFGHEVEEARWDEENHRWTVTARRADGTTVELSATALISAVGLHNRPRIPEFPGADEFRGEIFHSAQWPDDAPIDGRRVAVIGSGATGMQVVPAIAERVESLTVIQRTAYWIAPNEHYFSPFPEHKNWLLDHVPFYRGWYRFRLHWVYAERLYPALVVDPAWDRSRNSVNAISDSNRKYFTAYLRSQLDGHDDLIEKSTPTFPPFAKRILLDNGWYATLKRPNVELITDDVERLTETGLVTASGEHREVDTIVLCTGFQQQRFLHPMKIYGADGRALHEEWAGDDARAHLGLTSPGFPNLFYLYGPNTNPPGGSWITIAEDQVRYVVDLLARMVREDIAAVEVREDRYEEYNAEVDRRNEQMVVAAPGVDSYYRNASGRVVTNSPWTILEYWSQIREPDLDDFVVTPVDALAARS